MRRWGNFSVLVMLWLGAVYFWLWKGGFAASFLSWSGALLIGYLLYVQCVPLSKVKVEIKAAERSLYTEGELAKLQVKVIMPRRLPFVWLGLQDEWQRLAVFPGFRKQMTYQIKTDALSRGRFQSESLRIYVMDLFGAIIRSKEVSLPAWGWIYPRFVKLDKAALSKQTSLNGKRNLFQLAAEPAFVNAIRDYEPGDPLNRIHWKATARQQQLQTKVNEPSKLMNEIICLDTMTTLTTISTLTSASAAFEQCVRIAAALFNQAWQHRRYPGLALWQETGLVYFPPGDRARSAQIMQALSLCQGVKSRSLSELVEAIPNDERMRSSLVAVTPQISAPPVWTAGLTQIAHLYVPMYREKSDAVPMYRENSDTVPVYRENSDAAWEKAVRHWQQQGCIVHPVELEEAQSHVTA